MEEYLIELMRQIEDIRKRVDALMARGNPSAMYAGNAHEVTLSSGEFTAVYGYYIVEPETSTTDDLDTINHRNTSIPQEGKKVLLRTSAGNTITVKDGTGNIDLTALGGDTDLDDPAKTLVLVYDTTLSSWIPY